VVLEGVLTLVALVLLLYLLRRRRAIVKPFDPYSPPSIVVVGDPHDPFVLRVKTLTELRGFRVLLKSPKETHFPPGSVLAQGRFFWYSRRTFNLDEYLYNLDRMRESWETVGKYQEYRLRRSAVVFTEPLYATANLPFAPYASKSVYVSPDLTPTGIAVSPVSLRYYYSPHLVEALSRISFGVVDMSQRVPIQELVYVTMPEAKKEVVS